MNTDSVTERIAAIRAFIDDFDTQKEAAEEIGVSESTLSRALSVKTTTYKRLDLVEGAVARWRLAHGHRSDTISEPRPSIQRSPHTQTPLGSSGHEFEEVGRKVYAEFEDDRGFAFRIVLAFETTETPPPTRATFRYRSEEDGAK